MAGQIRVTPDTLKDRATTYNTASNTVNEVLQTLQSLQNELRAEWEGQAFNKFDEQYTQLEPKVKEFAQLLDDINKQLVSTANAMADHDVALSQNFGFNA